MKKLLLSFSVITGLAFAGYSSGGSGGGSGGGGTGAVSSVFGRAGGVLATSGDYTSDQVTEGTTNLYSTTARTRSAVTATAPMLYNSATGVVSLPTGSNGQIFRANSSGVLGLENGLRTITITADKNFTAAEWLQYDVVVANSTNAAGISVGTPTPTSVNGKGMFIFNRNTALVSLVPSSGFVVGSNYYNGNKDFLRIWSANEGMFIVSDNTTYNKLSTVFGDKGVYTSTGNLTLDYEYPETLIDRAGANVTYTLPAVTATSLPYASKKFLAINANGGILSFSGTINNSLSPQVPANGYVEFVQDGTGWTVSRTNVLSLTVGALPTLQGGVPTGGTTGQVLTKNSNTNYDYAWVTSASGGGGGTPAGSDKQLQYNNAGAFGALPAYWESASKLIRLDGSTGTANTGMTFQNGTDTGTTVNDGIYVGTYYGTSGVLWNKGNQGVYLKDGSGTASRFASNGVFLYGPNYQSRVELSDNDVRIGVGANSYALHVTTDGQVQATGGITLATTGTKPTCDSTRRGQAWVVQSASGTADLIQFCLKGTDDAYAWRSVTYSP